MKIIAVCHTCAKKHPIEFDPQRGPGAAFSDWMTKHPQPHDIDFWYPGRSYKKPIGDVGILDGYIDNADIKIAYAADADYTKTLASLAEDANLLTGRETGSVDNTSNLYLDWYVTGKIEVGTSPTTNGDEVIEVLAIGPEDDTPTWPDVFDGTDSAETITNDNIKNSIARYVARIQADDGTTGAVYPFGPVHLSSLFGGLPSHHVLFITHSTGVNLDSTEGNHVLTGTGVYATSA